MSALNEDLELISVRYAAKVFRDSFMKSAQAGKMGLPTIPLSQLYAAAIGYIEPEAEKCCCEIPLARSSRKLRGCHHQYRCQRTSISRYWLRHFRALEPPAAG